MLSVAMELSAFCFTVAVISSTDADTSSALAACSAAPCDSCCAVEEICSEPEETWSVADRMLSTMRRRSRDRASRALAKSPISSGRFMYTPGISLRRSPCAISPRCLTAIPSGLEMELDSHNPRTMDKIVTQMMTMIMVRVEELAVTVLASDCAFAASTFTLVISSMTTFISFTLVVNKPSARSSASALRPAFASSNTLSTSVSNVFSSVPSLANSSRSASLSKVP